MMSNFSLQGLGLSWILSGKEGFYKAFITFSMQYFHFWILFTTEQELIRNIRYI